MCRRNWQDDEEQQQRKEDLLDYGTTKMGEMRQFGKSCGEAPPKRKRKFRKQVERKTQSSGCFNNSSSNDNKLSNIKIARESRKKKK